MIVFISKLIPISVRNNGIMKSKPIIMEQFSTRHTSYIVNFQFTILTGDSATGKSASFPFIKEYIYKNFRRNQNERVTVG